MHSRAASIRFRGEHILRVRRRSRRPRGARRVHGRRREPSRPHDSQLEDTGMFRTDVDARVGDVGDAFIDVRLDVRLSRRFTVPGDSHGHDIRYADGERPAFGHRDDNVANRHESPESRRVALHTHPRRSCPVRIAARVRTQPRRRDEAAAAWLSTAPPQATAFYRVMVDHLETMLQDARDHPTHPHRGVRALRRVLPRGVRSPA